MTDVLRVRDLKVYLDVDAGVVKAVDGVSFRVPEGGTVALVGESGSGKSMVAQAIMSILPRVPGSKAGRSCLPIRSAAARSSISRGQTRMTRRCASYAAAACRSFSRSR
jgi:ABC-type dipeptide/oligopeptide/nickel transport system ATPase component